MKKLIFLGEEYIADKIIKNLNEQTIIGYTNNVEVFSFRGINDFNLFNLKDDAEYDVEDNTEKTLLKQIADLKVENMKKDTTINNTLKALADLKLEVMNMKGGN
ncbi:MULTISPECIES: hypothetical protein [Clostridium]|uniref:RNA polymerase sigma factor n=2 Tax=Clostridium TaxID=1485 RepID=A0AAD1YCV4_9CLOT|nr:MULTISPECIES: hypothetical protein [Clostridium]CAI3195854.1 RNA polymerase sigma factor [Clostridium neonatale]CAI3196571.1 RNA polymerase sigma factor [Clostridium neonatale]CAI3203629.1 RNA polymerase sigma factor [Clostridium neonatale]CAI3225978.1 RNA polymerase sigma factor [Clostridium neonatale]CAI3226488.1 RNA polymerase sigma factor [Clostridium neonatale]